MEKGLNNVKGHQKSLVFPGKKKIKIKNNGSSFSRYAVSLKGHLHT